MHAEALMRSDEPFAEARAKFEELTERLGSRESMTMSHSELERLIHTEGIELLRRLFQGYLDARGPGIAAEPVIGTDGVERSRVRLRERKLMTVFGPVQVERAAYSTKEVGSLHPLDADLNLPTELYSHEVRRRVAREASKGSYDETVECLKTLTGAAVPKRQAEQLAVRAAQDFDAFYQKRQQEAEQAPSSELVILSADGKGVVMRTEDLREGTRKAEENRSHKLQKRLSKGEKANAKRMATVAAVYTLAPFPRTAEEILGELSSAQRKELKRPRPEGKRVWASLEKEPQEVIHEAFREALRRDPKKQKKWVALVDGNKPQLRILRRLSRDNEVRLIIVLDLIHVIEYLWRAATVFNPEGSPSTEAWVNERLRAILEGRAGYVAAGIRRSATKRGLSPDKRAPADECARYLLTYAEYMRYDEYLAQGLPIATGVIEGACRYLVKDRMDITGARWSLKGAEAVLQLRSLRASGDFDEYWQFHEAKELERNHVSQYAAGLPKLAPPPRGRAKGSHLRVVK